MFRRLVEIKGCPFCHAQPVIKKGASSDYFDRYECECDEHALLQILRGITHCPSCGSPKKIETIQSFTISCPHHPDPKYPVLSKQDSLDLVLWDWNDNDSTWLLFGADVSKLASRPIFKLDIRSLGLHDPAAGA